jgi:hypothetical protein
MVKKKALIQWKCAASERTSYRITDPTFEITIFFISTDTPLHLHYSVEAVLL